MVKGLLGKGWAFRDGSSDCDDQQTQEKEG